MKNYKVKIDLKAFLETGEFDCLKLGQTKEWVLNNFPLSDDYEDTYKSHGCEIFTYGGIELHFSENILFTIFTDYISQDDGEETFYGGKSISFINQWIFSSNSKKLTFDYVKKSFEENLMEHSVTINSALDSRTIHSSGGAELYFDLNMGKKSVEYTLTAMYLK